MKSKRIEELEKKIGYSFKNKNLILTALTHSSYSNELSGMVECYERLEFLGDSILGFVTAKFLYEHNPSLPEGQMTRLRAALVCENSLRRVASEIGIGSFMRIGRGEELSGGRERTSVLADMVESTIAAIFLDSDIDCAEKFIRSFILDDADIDTEPQSDDYKTALQEIVQKQPDAKIVYEEISESGPDHNKKFTYRVLVNDVELGTGTGRRKKLAEQEAARSAIEVLKNDCT